MKKRINKKNISVLITCLISVCSFFSCSLEQDVQPGEVPAVTVPEAVSETVTEAEEPAVTQPEPEKAERGDYSAVRKRSEDTDKNRLAVLSDYSTAYEVVNGYYRINFIEDKLFLEEINDDIRVAMDSLRKFYTPDYGELASRSHSAEVISTKGVVADIICRNGFLSIMLEYGYVEPFARTQAGAYSVLMSGQDISFDHAVTLNYDLVTKNRITDFNDLFYEDTDWYSTVRYAEDYICRGSVPYFAEEKPDMFTIDYIVYAVSDGMAAVRYNTEDLSVPLCSDMISSDFRDMRGSCKETSMRNFSMYTEKTMKRCDSCGQYYEYRQIDTSRFFDASKISELNSQLDRLYDNGFPGRVNHECMSLRSAAEHIEHFIPELMIRENNTDLWAFKDKDGIIGFYDPDSYTRLSAYDILGYNWGEYACVSGEENIDTGSCNTDRFCSLKYFPEDNKVKSELRVYSDEYGHDITVTVDVPADIVNQRYLANMN